MSVAAQSGFYRRVLRYFAPEMARILLLLVLISLSTLLGLLAVWPLAILVDSVLVRNGTPSPLMHWLPDRLTADPAAQIMALAVSLFVLRFSQELLGGWRNLLSLGICNAGVMRVRCDLFRKLHSLNLRFHRSQPQGDTIYRLTHDAQGCQQILNVLIDVLVAAVTLVAMLAVMLSRSVELTLVALGAVPLLIAANCCFARVLGNCSRDARRLESRFTSTVQRSVASISLILAFGRQQDEYCRFRTQTGESLHAWYLLQRQMSWYRISVGLIFGAGTAVILGWGGMQAYRDQVLGRNADGMTVGSLMVFITYLGMFYEPLCKVTGAGASLLEGVTGMERIFEVLDSDNVLEDRPGAVSLPVQQRRIAFDNLSFAYDPAKPVLRNLNLEIAPGRMLAFVGSSGVGKSTIMNLLGRFYSPTSGQIRLDEHDIANIRLEDLRRHVAFVLQENLVLPTTVAENIAYGNPQASLEEIQRAATLAGAAGFIESLPEGYQTELTEGGQNLSGGQRQRIAIARALLTDAPIIVLDEPTSALDAEHERRIVETLRQLKGERTILLISHRIGTVIDCDQICVMREGRVVGQGTHAELLAHNDWYRDMVRHQLPLAAESRPGRKPVPFSAVA